MLFNSKSRSTCTDFCEEPYSKESLSLTFAEFRIRQTPRDQRLRSDQRGLRCRGVGDAFDDPGFVQAYVRPLFCRGKGMFRWAALSGDQRDIDRTEYARLKFANRYSLG